ncbi:hypothetical protein BGZ60DRAFT_50756 [Tricladium varicosporioides]|nr:hypothetical protein BGZ60DRAFT_50756 [Hymenoscyphus varicosporioides]
MAFPILTLAAQIRSTILLYVALLTPPTTLSQRTLCIFFLPAIYLCHLYTFSSPLAFLSILHCFWSTHLLLFTNPRENFRLICRSKFKSRNGETREWKEGYPKGLKERFGWVSKLLLSPRMIGWDTSAPADTPGSSASATSIPKSKRRSSPLPKATPRTSPSPSPIPRVQRQRLSTWLIERFALVIIYFILIDATNWWMHHDHYFHNIYIHEKGDLDTGLFHTKALWTSFLTDLPKWVDPLAMRILVFGIQEYVLFSYIHSLFAICFVALGRFGIVGEFWGSPYNWPPLFGSLSSVFERGLRGFWGGFWHQLFREMFLGPGKALARVLGLSGKSTTRLAIITTTAFFTSGAFHALTLPNHIDGVDERIAGPSPLGYASFFWLQGACVLFEILINKLMTVVMPERNRGTWSRLLFGMISVAWVIGVLYYSAPLIIDELVKVMRATGLRSVFLFPLGERFLETTSVEPTPIIELIEPPLTTYLIGAATTMAENGPF